jgi:hypothetical protein
MVTIKILTQGWTSDHNFAIDIEELIELGYEIVSVTSFFGELKVVLSLHKNVS